jgi:hypothetical protein
MELWVAFEKDHPSLNFSKWVSLQIAKALKQHPNQSDDPTVNWKQLAKSTGLTIDELKEIQRVSEEDSGQMGQEDPAPYLAHPRD